jgi:hypothetical protein
MILFSGCAVTDNLLLKKDPQTGEVQIAPWLKAVQTGANFIPGWGQLAGAALGVFALAYKTHRNGKVNHALVDAIEAFRRRLRQDPDGIKLDEQFLDLLKKVQDRTGVQKDVSKIVDKRTDWTRNPTELL